MDQRIQEITNEVNGTPEYPEFSAGDTVNVTYMIREGEKQRPQSFQGTIIQTKGKGPTGTFTIRKVSSGVGIERIFPLGSTAIESIEVKKRGSVRRARIFYLRDRQGKATRIKEKRH
ncbi:50S ribosomal protein L19 [Salibacter sp.]|jgi:large subunit ribosomal protein L19|uniref:50S ribosomal protein L19 n=1 Tax=Salibacter sp. TaxID=2010995 RepID=UPI0028700476|nr:50S ribosomal protein L19 [Salibacter sp.]MDR9398265.1 50S ribosomal protein L19 [Salibacter sp.]MDR9487725.1 50S ribosomal protein L19 [Salibacter sp.]